MSVALPSPAASWAQVPLYASSPPPCLLSLLFTPTRPATTCCSLPGSYLPASTCLSQARPSPPIVPYEKGQLGTAPQCQCQCTPGLSSPSYRRKIKTTNMATDHTVGVERDAHPISNLYRPHLSTGKPKLCRPHTCPTSLK